MTNETHARQCGNKLEGFKGCTGTPRPGVESCEPCFTEYRRRRKAIAATDERENAELYELVKTLAVGEWSKRPRIVVTTLGLFGGDKDQDPRRAHLAADGLVWLLERSNSRRGATISWRGWWTANQSLRAVSTLDSKGNKTTIWTSSTPFGCYDLRAKTLADSMELTHA
jgi:hypothetical protein